MKKLKISLIFIIVILVSLNFYLNSKLVKLNTLIQDKTNTIEVLSKSNSKAEKNLQLIINENQKLQSTLQLQNNYPDYHNEHLELYKPEENEQKAVISNQPVKIFPSNTNNIIDEATSIVDVICYFIDENNTKWYYVKNDYTPSIMGWVNECEFIPSLYTEYSSDLTENIAGLTIGSNLNEAIQILGDNYNAIYNDLKLDIYWDNVVVYVEPYTKKIIGIRIINEIDHNLGIKKGMKKEDAYNILSNKYTVLKQQPYYDLFMIDSNNKILIEYVDDVVFDILLFNTAYEDKVDNSKFLR